MISEDFFRDRLRFFRNERGISAREMSLGLGQNETYINKIETGKCTTTINSFLNICEYLCISPADFFSEEIKNVETDLQELNRYFRLLTPYQAKYMLSFLKDLSICNKSK